MPSRPTMLPHMRLYPSCHVLPLAFEILFIEHLRLLSEPGSVLFCFIRNNIDFNDNNAALAFSRLLLQSALGERLIRGLCGQVTDRKRENSPCRLAMEPTRLQVAVLHGAKEQVHSTHVCSLTTTKKCFHSSTPSICDDVATQMSKYFYELRDRKLVSSDKLVDCGRWTNWSLNRKNWVMTAGSELMRALGMQSGDKKTIKKAIALVWKQIAFPSRVCYTSCCLLYERLFVYLTEEHADGVSGSASISLFHNRNLILGVFFGTPRISSLAYVSAYKKNEEILAMKSDLEETLIGVCQAAHISFSKARN